MAFYLENIGYVIGHKNFKQRLQMIIKKPNNCWIDGDGCPFLNQIEKNRYSRGKANLLFKCRIEAGMVLRRIRRRNFPKCEWGETE